MVDSETRIGIEGLAHVTVLIFIAIFIEAKLGIKTEEDIDNVIYEEPVKIIKEKDAVVKKERVEAREKLSNKHDSLEQRLMRFIKR